MLLLASSYVSVTQFRAQEQSDVDLSGYTDANLQIRLNNASGVANSILNQDLRAQEVTKRFTGDGTHMLELHQRPILYVKRVQVVLPGTPSYALPLNQLLIDYAAGEVLNYTPLYLQGLGTRSLFPRNAPIDVTLGWGYGYSSATAPTWTAADVGIGIPAGTYNVAVTAKTQWGETTAVVQSVTTTGAFDITFTAGLGAYLYRAYLSPATHNTTTTATQAIGDTHVTLASVTGITAGSRWLLGSGADAEVVTVTGSPSGSVMPISALVNAHDIGEAFIPVPLLVSESPTTTFGTTTDTILVNALVPDSSLYQDEFPTVDTSMYPVPNEIVEAVSLLALSAIWERSNPANRGIATAYEGDVKMAFRSTEGNSGKGTSLAVSQATSILAPLALNEIY